VLTGHWLHWGRSLFSQEPVTSARTSGAWPSFFFLVSLELRPRVGKLPACPGCPSRERCSSWRELSLWVTEPQLAPLSSDAAQNWHCEAHRLHASQRPRGHMGWSFAPSLPSFRSYNWSWMWGGWPVDWELSLSRSSQGHSLLTLIPVYTLCFAQTHAYYTPSTLHSHSTHTHNYTPCKYHTTHI
jgi:hypothetical protein